MNIDTIMRSDPLLERYYRALASLPDLRDRKVLIREIAKHDLYFLAKIILGYHWLTSPVHSEFARQIERERNLSLYLLPRGHCKTQIFTIADGIRQYLRQPTEPIAIVCDALKRSVKKLRSIRWHFEKNILFRSLFPDYTWESPYKQAPRWTDEEFILPHHTGRQEPSFQAASLDHQPTGLHFPVIKCDDIVTPETCTTREQMDKCRNGYGLMRSSILQTGGNIQIAGTIYDDGDLHCEMSKEGTGYNVYRKPAIDPETGAALWPEQFDLDVLQGLRRDPLVGEYIFSCNPGYAPVWMVDGTFKAIGEIKPGDEVVGYVFGQGRKAHIKRARVTEVNSRMAETVKLAMESGREVICTPDHQWYTGRFGTEIDRRYDVPRVRPPYLPAKVGRRLMHVIDPPSGNKQQREWAYLAGMIDGEGACKYGSTVITQSRTKNPAVTARIEENLTALQVPFKVYRDKRGRKSAEMFVINGGKQTKVDIINYGQPAKASQLMQTIWDEPGSFIDLQDKVVAITPHKTERVYSMVTETGNYVIWGYASKNCQYLLDPSPEDTNAYFKLSDFGRYREAPRALNIYAAIDTALSESTTADYTSIMIVGVDNGNKIHVLDVIRGRWDALTVAETMLKTQRTHNPLIWGCQGDNIIKAIGPFLRKMMSEQATYINLERVTPANKDKIANARSIQGRARQGFVMLPERRIDQPAWLQPLEHEIKRFPRGEHDDQVDNLATIGHLMDNMAAVYDKTRRPKDFASAHIDHIEGKGKPRFEEAVVLESNRFARNLRNQYRDRRIYHDLD